MLSSYLDEDSSVTLSCTDASSYFVGWRKLILIFYWLARGCSPRDSSACVDLGRGEGEGLVHNEVRGHVLAAHLAVC